MNGLGDLICRGSRALLIFTIIIKFLRSCVYPLFGISFDDELLNEDLRPELGFWDERLEIFPLIRHRLPTYRASREATPLNKQSQVLLL